MKHVVAIDDDENVLKLVQLVLDRNSFQVECFQNANAAFVALKSMEPLPCALLIGAGLPTPESKQFLDSKSADARLKNIPTVLMTARINSWSDILIELGIADFIGKPVNIRELVDALNRHCKE